MDHKTLVFQLSFISHDMYKKNIETHIHKSNKNKNAFKPLCQGEQNYVE